MLGETKERKEVCNTLPINLLNNLNNFTDWYMYGRLLKVVTVQVVNWFQLKLLKRTTYIEGNDWNLLGKLGFLWYFV